MVWLVIIFIIIIKHLLYILDTMLESGNNSNGILIIEELSDDISVIVILLESFEGNTLFNYILLKLVSQFNFLLTFYFIKNVGKFPTVSKSWVWFWVFILLHTKKTYFIFLISSYFWSSQLINFFCRITLPTAFILFKISSLKIILFITGNPKIIVLLPANITYS